MNKAKWHESGSQALMKTKNGIQTGIKRLTYTRPQDNKLYLKETQNDGKDNTHTHAHRVVEQMGGKKTT